MAEDALALTDITTNDVTISKHGFTPKAPNDTTKFLRGDATWAAPSGGNWTLSAKAADQTVNNSTTLVNDDTLKFTMAANTSYEFRLYFMFNTAAAADFKWRHTGPASPTRLSIARHGIVMAGSSFSAIATDSAYSSIDITMLSASAADPGAIWAQGIIQNGANAGDFQVQWAQNTADASNTQVYKGSWIEYRSF